LNTEKDEIQEREKFVPPEKFQKVTTSGGKLGPAHRDHDLSHKEGGKNGGWDTRGKNLGRQVTYGKGDANFSVEREIGGERRCQIVTNSKLGRKTGGRIKGVINIVKRLSP